MTKRLGRSKLEVVGADSASHSPEARSGAAASLPAWAGSCLGSSEHHPKLEAVSCPGGAFRAKEVSRAVLFSSLSHSSHYLLLPALNCGLMLITKSAKGGHRVCGGRDGRQELQGDGTTSERWVLGGQASTRCVQQLPCKPFHLWALPSLCSLQKHKGKKRGENVEPGAAACEGRGRRGCSHPKAPTLPGQTHHPRSMAACKDALSSAKPHRGISLSHGPSKFCQRMLKHRCDRVCILPLGTLIYIPVPFLAVCDNMSDFTPERLRPSCIPLSANCCECRWEW